jgi:NOL1/NOP2/fmu family ribosome biogenesis protein
MFVTEVLRQCLTDRESVVLDLCAAPGGKSLNILNHLNGQGLLVSNEIIRSRNNILKENISKWGFANVMVSMNEPHAFSSLPPLFDCIVIDAPCSGEGLFRRDPKACEQWSLEAVDFCASRQKKILADATPCLKSDGLLIYSTCTYAEQENQHNVDFLIDLGFEPVDITIPEAWGVTQVAKGCMAFHPHKVSGEGLFMAVLRKTTETSEKKFRGKSEFRMSKEDLTGFVRSDAACYTSSDGDIFSLPTPYIDVASELNDSLYITKMGVRIGEFMKGKLVPDHELTLSEFVPDSFSSISLTKEQALRYLRRETFDVGKPEDGMYLARYEEATLGWIKIAAGRMKNHYPKHWRIRKELNAL